ncbi:hypothetical protein [Halorubrum sodomense]|nr:hypothetical protein [Halorubrum sodomense]
MERTVVLIAVCLVAAGGIAAGVYGASAPVSDAGNGTAVADEPDRGRASPGDVRRQTEGGPAVIEPGETVTGTLSAFPVYAFDIEPGERATIEFSLEEPTDTSMVYTASVRAEMPDGSVAPDSAGLGVQSGETGRFNATTKAPGRATVRVESTTVRATGTFELSLEIAQTADVPDEPNDDRENATRLELTATDAGRNATVSADLEGADVDYYAFTLPDYETPEQPRSVTVPVTVTVDRESADGVSVLNVDTAPAGEPTDTATRYVGSGAPATIRFSAEESEWYFVAVADVADSSGPYELNVTVDESAVTAEPVPENGTQSLDQISRVAYGIPFDELSEPTARLVRSVHDRQDAETKLTKDELSRMRYEMPFSELSGETKGKITTLYRAQFPDGPP